MSPAAEATRARAAQVALAQQAASDVKGALPSLITATRDDFVRFFEALILGYRSRSRSTAFDSYNRLRTELVGAPVVPPLQLSDAVESWLLDAVGFSHYRMQQLTRQYEMAGHTLTPNRLTRAVSPGLAAVVEKASLDAGRESVEDLIVHDNQATGRYARIARPKACGWCKMLASRGFVYQEETVIKTKNGNDYHVGCRCVPIPQFTEDQDLPEQNRALADLWAESTRGLSGKDAISAFRAATGETKGTKWPERASD